ncbi:hypothetical protein IV203_028001 [Nitzschia inconspicua]|uniref:Uncharacterized protein n=1 Tax=Nitzschia inconspicua TaxID=303405 RepID=A0A9K3Q4N6_9STRA|nr:hypothetical protein IV203_028001 [Nitzschia inconspicua]
MIGIRDSSSGRRAVMNQSLQKQSSTAKQKPETGIMTKEEVSAISAVLQNTMQINKHELGIQIFELMLDEVNKEEETWKALVLARPERFDDPAALADWYPFQQWKAAEKKKEQILKEMHGFGKNLLHGETTAVPLGLTLKLHMGCTESVPVLLPLQPELVGVWVNTKNATLMDSDLGGSSSPVRFKSIHVSDGQFLCRRGTSPWTENRPSASDRVKIWVRLSIHQDGRVRYEQLDYQGSYYVLEFPMNAPLEESARPEVSNNSNNNGNWKEDDEAKRTEGGAWIEDQPAEVTRTMVSGSMEYRNGIGETRARINFEYFPKLLSRFIDHGESKTSSSQRSMSSSSSNLTRERSKLRIMSPGTGKSHILVRCNRPSKHNISSIS